MPDESVVFRDPQPLHPPQLRRRLGRHLVDARAIRDTDLLRALVLQRHQDAPLGHILISQGWADPDQVLEALSQQQGLQRVDLSDITADSRLLNRKPAQFWLKHRAVPWTYSGSQLVVAIAHPEHFETLKTALRGSFDSIRPVLAAEDQVTAFLTAHFRKELALAASTRVPLQDSSRHWHTSNRPLRPLMLLVALAGLTGFAPRLVFTGFCALSVIALSLFVGLKLIGFASHLARAAPVGQPPLAGGAPHKIRRLPRISMLVPLFHESEVSKALLRRLQRLTYPRSLLEVFLVLEEHDEITRNALAKVTLPRWVKIVEVPKFGSLTTKPRAMNYALDFCHGDIIGVWDAEDAPARGQLEQVARRFEQVDADVACLQGVLDFYNPRSNWLSRCFTLEYASWFRIVLPGLAHLGLVIPLGGTTLFVRRDALEKLGGWDAHNVTEDADLGVRLYRAGYRTEMIATATHEEANCRPWPWIRQRSRWLKGFMVTYLVHMRRPRVLLTQLGWKRFLGFQAFFLGSVGQFLLAPFLWSFWLILLGLPHPSAALLPAGLLIGTTLMLIVFELLGICIAIMAAFASNRRSLALWAPTMMLYFPLGAVAAYKALHELIWHPFFWDKTEHGHRSAEPETPPPAP
ncbi:glycosyltransferase [Parasedimentitalea psychrophila]|uniref:Glycosyltransferase n=1 Tax=Parasedimentitalea psychrophila TaxID=2997337 RepID=A0A9Y2P7J2_9RHOB|nr:glycosyltransferase [Parasedimentitalea psychrophila]WIY25875.1 glycosyltransferase [Parasedimentitalea psychrophila]